MTDTSQRYGRFPNGRTDNYGYDGDGRKVKTYNNATPQTVTYTITSTVLGGRKFVDVRGSDLVKTKGYVYADGGELVEWNQSSVGDGISWKHTDPHRIRERKTLSGGLNSGQIVELDPLGRSVGRINPNEIPTFPPEFINHFPGAGDIRDFGACTLDGGMAPCSMVMGFLNNGSAYFLPGSETGWGCNGRGECRWVQFKNGSYVPLGYQTLQDFYAAQNSTQRRAGPSKGKESKPRYDQKKLEQAIHDCIQELWGKDLAFIALDPSRKGHNGKIIIAYTQEVERRSASGLSGASGTVKDLDITLYTITNDVVSFTSNDLTALAGVGAIGIGPSERGWGDDGNYSWVKGYKNSWVGFKYKGKNYNPSWTTNFTASDREKWRGQGFERLEGDLGGYLETQIHELGNSLAAKFGYRGNRNAKPGGNPCPDIQNF
jgi:hypothetical protein